MYNPHEPYSDKEVNIILVRYGKRERETQRTRKGVALMTLME